MITAAAAAAAAAVLAEAAAAALALAAAAATAAAAAAAAAAARRLRQPAGGEEEESPRFAISMMLLRFLALQPNWQARRLAEAPAGWPLGQVSWRDIYDGRHAIGSELSGAHRVLRLPRDQTFGRGGGRGDDDVRHFFFSAACCCVVQQKRRSFVGGDGT